MPDSHRLSFGADVSVEHKKRQILALTDRLGVKFLRLQFTDILGVVKNVEVPHQQFARALDGRVSFDGSSIEGFMRLEESDVFLRPDLNTFRIFPWTLSQTDRIARVICDIENPDGTPFPGCPRHALKRVLALAASRGFSMVAGPETEFFLFQKRNGEPTTDTHDAGGYFDLTPVDLGEDVRRQTVLMLEGLGIDVEAAHHEVAAGQHEIDLRIDDALATADHMSTFRFVVKHVALVNGLHATFMPKPTNGSAGSGLHVHQALFHDAACAFHDEDGPWGLSTTCLHYVGGLLKHARAMCAVTNPLVNSYKRLLSGFEAPTNIVWSERNRSPLVRVPPARGNDTRVELRMPDPSCNPYLALAVMLRSGLDGIEQRLEPGPPVNKDIDAMSHRERRHLRIDELPTHLGEALDALEKDEVVRDALGEQICDHMLAARRTEWESYACQVSGWELDRYLKIY